MSATSIAPHTVRAISNPRFIVPNVTVRSAGTVSDGTSPVVASTPLGMSSATTNAAASGYNYTVGGIISSGGFVVVGTGGASAATAK